MSIKHIKMIEDCHKQLEELKLKLAELETKLKESKRGRPANNRSNRN